MYQRVYSSFHRTNHPLYATWQGIIARCTDPNFRQYKDYGGRGICYCDKWADFEGFLEDVGDRPFKGASIDRVNPDGHYHLENFRWADRKQQGQNKSREVDAIPVDFPASLCVQRRDQKLKQFFICNSKAQSKPKNLNYCRKNVELRLEIKRRAELGQSARTIASRLKTTYKFVFSEINRFKESTKMQPVRRQAGMNT